MNKSSNSILKLMESNVADEDKIVLLSCIAPVYLVSFLNDVDMPVEKDEFGTAELIKFIFEKKVTRTMYHCNMKGKKSNKKKVELNYGAPLAE